MRIERDDFIMESVRPDCEYTWNWFFDLYLKKTIKGKDGERQEWKLEGYGCITPTCIEYIASLRFKNKLSEEYKSEYQKLYDEFKELGLKVDRTDWKKKGLD